jgi:hypothetical protein
MDTLPPFSNYSYIYISIGSKQNDTVVHYEYPPKKPIVKYSNAYFQMLPPFVKSRRDPTLVICLEQGILQAKPQCNSNIQIFLYDTGTGLPSLQLALTTISNRLIGFPKERIIIANFIRFISPNSQEAYIETEIPEMILSILSKRHLDDRFYQWFGYQPNLYSVMYRPNQIMYMYLTRMYMSLSKNLGTNELNIYSIERLLDDPLVPWGKVLPHMIDFVHTEEWNQSLSIY